MVYLNPGDSSYMEFDVTSPVDGPFSRLPEDSTKVFSAEMLPCAI
jgi:hypothetical protein